MLPYVPPKPPQGPIYDDEHNEFDDMTLQELRESRPLYEKPEKHWQRTRSIEEKLYERSHRDVSSNDKFSL